MTTTVFCLRVLLHASQQAITTSVCTDCAKSNGCTSFLLFLTPQTFLRPYWRAGMSITVPGSCPAEGIDGSRVKPDSSQEDRSIFPCSACLCHASRARFHWAKAMGARRLFQDFLTRVPRRRACFARRFQEAMRRRLAVVCANRSTTCVRERGSSVRYG